VVQEIVGWTSTKASDEAAAAVIAAALTEVQLSVAPAIEALLSKVKHESVVDPHLDESVLSFVSTFTKKNHNNNNTILTEDFF
jgi:hypothetical protein